MKEEYVDLFSNSHDQFCMKKKSSIHEEGHQARVVQKVDSAIRWINLSPVVNAIGFPNTYLLDSDLSGG